MRATPMAAPRSGETAYRRPLGGLQDAGWAAAIAALVFVQGGYVWGQSRPGGAAGLGGLGLAAAAAGLLGALAAATARRPELRGYVLAAALGGVGMLVGARLDASLLPGVPSCHGLAAGRPSSLLTLGGPYEMAGMLLVCVPCCLLPGHRHRRCGALVEVGTRVAGIGSMLLGMMAAELAYRTVPGLAGELRPLAAHLTMVFGMAAGGSLGVYTARPLASWAAGG